jgi:hypothetical protein
VQNELEAKEKGKERATNPDFEYGSNEEAYMA